MAEDFKLHMTSCDVNISSFRKYNGIKCDNTHNDWKLIHFTTVSITVGRKLIDD